MKLVKALEDIMQEEGLSIRQFAKKLGISATYLDLVYNGKRNIGLKFLNGILQEYPHLKPLVIDYIKGGQDDSS